MHRAASRARATGDAPGQPEDQPNGQDGGQATYTIGELADALQLTTRAIRFYESKGLITPSRKNANRIYSRRDRARLQLIMRGKNLGFSLEDIAQFLALYDADPSQLAQTRLLLGKVEAHIDDLQKKRADIERTLRDLKDIRGQCIQHLEGHRS
ncbi:MAG: MerR family DNA-binding transcriptional regulator [Hyphomicrobiales bacterium]|nr:MerR family DNA-binding transcriptional regulator [Hyphomicrobiales bacterium]